LISTLLADLRRVLASGWRRLNCRSVGLSQSLLCVGGCRVGRVGQGTRSHANAVARWRRPPRPHRQALAPHARPKLGPRTCSSRQRRAAGSQVAEVAVDAERLGPVQQIKRVACGQGEFEPELVLLIGLAGQVAQAVRFRAAEAIRARSTDPDGKQW
jgi:hypothetical protein